MLQQVVPTPSLWRLPIFHAGWLTLLSTIPTALSAAQEAGSLQPHYAYRKTSTALANQTFTGQPHHTPLLCTSFAQPSGGSTPRHLEFYHVYFSPLGLCLVWQHHSRHCRSFHHISNGVYFTCTSLPAAPIWPCLSAEGGRRCKSWDPLFLSIWCIDQLPGTSKSQLATVSKWKLTVLAGHNLQVFLGFLMSFMLVFETSRSERAEKDYQSNHSTCWCKVRDFIFFSKHKKFWMGCYSTERQFISSIFFMHSQGSILWLDLQNTSFKVMYSF